MNEVQKSPFLGLWFLGVTLILLLALLPNGYFLDIAIRMAINAIIIIMLNLLIGFAGQISLGHAAFFGIGAYSSAILPAHFGWPSALALVFGALFSGVLALILARLIFRFKGHYLAMVTLGLGIIVSVILTNETAWTGGPDGMAVQDLDLLGHKLPGDRSWLGLTGFLLILCVWGTINLMESPFGRALRALHGSETAAAAAGVDLARYKMAVFALSAVPTSIMGSLTAHYVGFVTPNLAGFTHSIEMLTMVVLGGMASIYGSVLGAVLLTALPQLLATLDGWETVALGAILVITMIFLPKGIVPTLTVYLGKHSR